MIGDQWIGQNGITVTWKISTVLRHTHKMGEILILHPLKFCTTQMHFIFSWGQRGFLLTTHLSPLEVAEVREERDLGIKVYIKRVTEEALH